MPHSSVFGRRIHIAGSIGKMAEASAAEVARARELVSLLAAELMRLGATFVIPVDAEKPREGDGAPICFDWLVWQAVERHLGARPPGAPNPVAIAVKHHKNEDQIPREFDGLWNRLRRSSVVQIESAAHWNMASKRMEIQARYGDILIALGGTEGVAFLANLYHDAGKPVIPLNLKLSPSGTGAARLFEFGQSGNNASRFFQTKTQTPAHWLNMIEMSSRKTAEEGVKDLLDLLEALVPPTAFVVRLLDPEAADFADVEDFFTSVVKPVVEDELGYKLTVVDGKQAYEYPRIDQEIFEKLHRSRIVIADITGSRPNCFIECGYAFGRSLPLMLLAKEGTSHPFDVTTLYGHRWKTTGTFEERREALRTHWHAIKNRPPLVSTEPLIP